MPVAGLELWTRPQDWERGCAKGPAPPLPPGAPPLAPAPPRPCRRALRPWEAGLRGLRCRQPCSELC